MEEGAPAGAPARAPPARVLACVGATVDFDMGPALEELAKDPSVTIIRLADLEAAEMAGTAVGGESLKPLITAARAAPAGAALERLPAELCAKMVAKRLSALADEPTAADLRLALLDATFPSSAEDAAALAEAGVPVDLALELVVPQAVCVYQREAVAYAEVEAAAETKKASKKKPPKDAPPPEEAPAGGHRPGILPTTTDPAERPPALRELATLAEACHRGEGGAYGGDLVYFAVREVAAPPAPPPTELTRPSTIETASTAAAEGATKPKAVGGGKDGGGKDGGGKDRAGSAKGGAKGKEKKGKEKETPAKEKPGKDKKKGAKDPPPPPPEPDPIELQLPSTWLEPAAVANTVLAHGRALATQRAEFARWASACTGEVVRLAPLPEEQRAELGRVEAAYHARLAPVPLGAITVATALEAVLGAVSEAVEASEGGGGGGGVAEEGEKAEAPTPAADGAALDAADGGSAAGGDGGGAAAAAAPGSGGDGGAAAGPADPRSLEQIEAFLSTAAMLSARGYLRPAEAHDHLADAASAERERVVLFRAHAPVPHGDSLQHWRLRAPPLAATALPTSERRRLAAGLQPQRSGGQSGVDDEDDDDVVELGAAPDAQSARPAVPAPDEAELARARRGAAAARRLLARVRMPARDRYWMPAVPALSAEARAAERSALLHAMRTLESTLARDASPAAAAAAAAAPVSDGDGAAGAAGAAGGGGAAGAAGKRRGLSAQEAEYAAHVMRLEDMVNELDERVRAQREADADALRDAIAAEASATARESTPTTAREALSVTAVTDGGSELDSHRQGGGSEVGAFRPGGGGLGAMVLGADGAAALAARRRKSKPPPRLESTDRCFIEHLSPHAAPIAWYEAVSRKPPPTVLHEYDAMSDSVLVALHTPAPPESRQHALPELPAPTDAAIARNFAAWHAWTRDRANTLDGTRAPPPPPLPPGGVLIEASPALPPRAGTEPRTDVYYPADGCIISVTHPRVAYEAPARAQPSGAQPGANRRSSTQSAAGGGGLRAGGGAGAAADGAGAAQPPPIAGQPSSGTAPNGGGGGGGGGASVAPSLPSAEPSALTAGSGGADGGAAEAEEPTARASVAARSWTLVATRVMTRRAAEELAAAKLKLNKKKPMAALRSVFFADEQFDPPVMVGDCELLLTFDDDRSSVRAWLDERRTCWLAHGAADGLTTAISEDGVVRMEWAHGAAAQRSASASTAAAVVAAAAATAGGDGGGGGGALRARAPPREVGRTVLPSGSVLTSMEDGSTRILMRDGNAAERAAGGELRVTNNSGIRVLRRAPPAGAAGAGGESKGMAAAGEASFLPAADIARLTDQPTGATVFSRADRTLVTELGDGGRIVCHADGTMIGCSAEVERSGGSRGDVRVEGGEGGGSNRVFLHLRTGEQRVECAGGVMLRRVYDADSALLALELVRPDGARLLFHALATARRQKAPMAAFTPAPVALSEKLAYDTDGCYMFKFGTGELTTKDTEGSNFRIRLGRPTECVCTPAVKDDLETEEDAETVADRKRATTVAAAEAAAEAARLLRQGLRPRPKVILPKLAATPATGGTHPPRFMRFHPDGSAIEWHRPHDVAPYFARVGASHAYPARPPTEPQCLGAEGELDGAMVLAHPVSAAPPAAFVTLLSPDVDELAHLKPSAVLTPDILHLFRFNTADLPPTPRPSTIHIRQLYYASPLTDAERTLFVATVREYHEWQARSRQALLDMRIEDSRSAAEIELQEALGAELRALEEEHARARAAQSQSSLAASTLALTARTSDEAAATTAGAADDPDAMESDDAGGGM